MRRSRRSSLRREVEGVEEPLWRRLASSVFWTALVLLMIAGVLVALFGCGDNSPPDEPPCERPSYGTSPCETVEGERGWCIVDQGRELGTCRLGCSSPSYSCPGGMRALVDEADECWCDPL